MLRRCLLLWSLGGLVLALFMPSGVLASSSQVEARALALEKKLMAPCCWQGTLEDHHSELADALHAEIRARLMQGEAAASIEQHLVSRFGERMIAVPNPGILEGTASLVMWVLLLAGGLLWLTARSWVRRTSATAAEPESAEAAGGTNASTSVSEYDLRLDAELKRLD